MNSNGNPADRLSELESAEFALQQEMHQLQHELRRVMDGIEREGGAGHSLEQKAKQLEDNINLCEDELSQNRKHQMRLLKILNDAEKIKNNGE